MKQVFIKNNVEEDLSPKGKKASPAPIRNKKATFNYTILEKMEAGIILTGAEVKSVRIGRADLSESFARIHQGQVIAKNIYILPYFGVRTDSYNPRRDRKLLLHRHQIETLTGKMNKGGMALIPLSLYFTRNMVKVELGLGQSKKKFDKRKSIKEQDEKRQLEQDIKSIKYD
jgi:SsrA-binding protein